MSTESARPACIMRGGPLDRWAYWLADLGPDADKGVTIRFGHRYRRTAETDPDGRQVWRFVPGAPIEQPLSTYDPDRAYWHSTHD